MAYANPPPGNALGLFLSRPQLQKQRHR